MSGTQTRCEAWLEKVEGGDRGVLPAMPAHEVEDAFFRDLAFGTSGLRGVFLTAQGS